MSDSPRLSIEEELDALGIESADHIKYMRKWLTDIKNKSGDDIINPFNKEKKLNVTSKSGTYSRILKWCIKNIPNHNYNTVHDIFGIIPDFSHVSVYSKNYEAKIKELKLKYDFKSNLTLSNYNKIKSCLPKDHMIYFDVGKFKYPCDILLIKFLFNDIKIVNHRTLPRDLVEVLDIEYYLFNDIVITLYKNLNMSIRKIYLVDVIQLIRNNMVYLLSDLLLDVSKIIRRLMLFKGDNSVLLVDNISRIGANTKTLEHCIDDFNLKINICKLYKKLYRPNSNINFEKIILQLYVHNHKDIHAAKHDGEYVNNIAHIMNYIEDKKYYDNSDTLIESDDVKILINFIKKAYKDIIIKNNDSKEIDIKDSEDREDSETSESKEDIFNKNKCTNITIDDDDVISHEPFKKLSKKRLANLTKIVRKNNEKVHVYCYDTVKLYEYILFMFEKGKRPVNLLTGHDDLLDDAEIEKIKSVYEKIIKKNKFSDFILLSNNVKVLAIKIGGKRFRLLPT